jgi:O-antigen ligase
MKRFERFLNSDYYIAIIMVITVVAWSFYKETPPYLFNVNNSIGMVFLVSVVSLSLILYRNTLYTIPPILGILIIINKSNMDLSTATKGGFIYYAFSIFVVGLIIHLIRFRPKLKMGIFFVGFLGIALSYVMPLFFIPFDITNIPTSLIAFLYLLLYVIISSTAKSSLDYLFKILLFLNLALTAQVFFYLYQGYLQNPDLEFFYRIFSGWNRNLGWANINDMCFYISLTFPGYIYFIFKRPKTYLIWLLMILPITAVILSKSRGGMMGFAVLVILSLLFFAIKGNKKHLTHGLVFLTVLTILSYVGREIFYIWWDYFKQTWSNDIDEFSTFRITIYKTGLKNFLDYPIFGAGWASLQKEFPGTRLFMYHSTIVQSLAAMGIFGFITLLIHYFQVFKYMLTKITLEKYLFLIGYLASQAHGLIDNVQYAVPYSIMIVFILAIFETSEKKTSFEEIDHKYHLLNL